MKRFAALSRAWDAFWFRPEPALNLLAARAIVCAQALWILLSRPDLPQIVAWPRAFWVGVDRAVAARFLLFGLPVGAERLLYFVLIAGLAAGIFGLFSRAAGIGMAVLLYHFAAFEDIFSSQGGPFFRGLGVPVVALLLLAVAQRPRAGAPASAEYRWPLASIQVLLALTYLSSGITKLRAIGPGWFSGRNFQGLVLGMILPEVAPAWARRVAENPAWCQAGAAAAFVLDFLLVIAAFSPRAARFAVPALAGGHLLIIPILGVVYLALPLLLVFVDWDGLLARVRLARGPAAREALSGSEAGAGPPRSLRR